MHPSQNDSPNSLSTPSTSDGTRQPVASSPPAKDRPLSQLLDELRKELSALHKED